MPAASNWITAFATGLTVLLAAMGCAVPAIGSPADPPEIAIPFHSDSFRALILEPQRVLESPEAFWDSDTAYRVLSYWHEASGTPIPHDAWRAALEQYASSPPGQRQALLAVVEGIEAEQQTFQRRARGHIASYLPPGALDRARPEIHLTTFAVPNAINLHDFLVINVHHPDFGGDPRRILHTLIHELFHSGYGACQPARTEPGLAGTVYSLLETLQNEGMATYVAWRASDLYADPENRDYRMLEDPDEVRRLRGEINSLLAAGSKLDSAELRQRSWDRGVQRRAYYVVGAHMARVIERKAGRDGLAATVSAGPWSYVKAYNASVSENERIHEVDVAALHTPAEDLRVALMAGDRERFVALAGALLAGRDDPRPDLADELLYAGVRLLKGAERPEDALRLFRLATALFPASAFAVAWTGEAQAALGHDDRARALASAALKLDPHNPRALALERRLGG